MIDWLSKHANMVLADKINEYWSKRNVKANARAEQIITSTGGVSYVVRSDLTGRENDN